MGELPPGPNCSIVCHCRHDDPTPCWCLVHGNGAGGRRPGPHGTHGSLNSTSPHHRDVLLLTGTYWCGGPSYSNPAFRFSTTIPGIWVNLPQYRCTIMTAVPSWHHVSHSSSGPDAPTGAAHSSPHRQGRRHAGASRPYQLFLDIAHRTCKGMKPNGNFAANYLGTSYGNPDGFLS